ncbi:MAG: hypothetical protein Q9215_005312 [Flavoplaca cf. flavocitrina]
MSADKDSPAHSPPRHTTSATVGAGDDDVVYPGHLNGRAIAGVGAGGILSGVLTILSNSVPRSKLAPVNGVLGAFTGLAFICGPLIGGGIISATTWRCIFWMNPILSVHTYASVVFWIHLKSTPKLSSWKEKLALLDLPAFTISLATIICLLLALQWGGTEYAWRNARIIVLFILFGILTGVFAAMEVRKIDNASVPLKIVTQRSIAFGIFFSFCSSGAGFVLEYYLPLWLQAVKDLSVISSAVHLLPSIIAALVCTIGSGILAPVIGYYVPFMLGAAVFLAVDMGLLSTLRWDVRMALILPRSCASADEYLDTVLAVYNGAAVKTWYLSLALACASVFGFAGMEWKRIKPVAKSAADAGSGSESVTLGGEQRDGGSEATLHNKEQKDLGSREEESPEINIDRMKNTWEVLMKLNAILRTQIVDLDTRALQVVLMGESLSWGDCTDLDTYLAVQGQHPMQYGGRLSCIAVSKTRIVWTVHHSFMEATKPNAAHSGRPDSQPKMCFHFHPLADKVTVHTLTQPWSTTRSGSFVVSSQVTTSTLFQAAWALDLSNHLSTQTVCFDLTVSGRIAAIAGIESMMGPTLATVPVCLELDMAQSLGHYLETVQKYSTQMIPYQHVGLQNIMKYSQEAAQACEFQNLSAIQPAEKDSPEPPYSHLLKREVAEIHKGFFNYALTVQCSLASSGVMRALAVFDEHLIHPSQMQRLLFQLEHVVRLVSPQDLAQIEVWNGKPGKTAGLPFDEIHRHFETSRSDPNQQQYLYHLSSRFANHLASKNGVGPEIIVLIGFDRSLWMIIAVIAVMRTGAAFTLLDPAYPVQRLERIIAIRGSGMVLVSRLCHDLFLTVASKCLTIDERFFAEEDLLSQAFTSRGKLPVCHVGEKDDKHAQLATTFPKKKITNGLSITEPKGVLVSHGSYYTGVTAHNPYYERVPARATYSSDPPHSTFTYMKLSQR